MLKGSCVWGSHQFWALPFFWVSCMIWQTDQSHLGLFFLILWTGKVEFAQPQELFHNFPANSLLARAQCDIARVYVIFLFREHPEFTRQYRHGDQPALPYCKYPDCVFRSRIPLFCTKKNGSERGCIRRKPKKFPQRSFLQETMSRSLSSKYTSDQKSIVLTELL